MINEHLRDFLVENPQQAKSIVMKSMEAARAREAARKARDIPLDEINLISQATGKLADCQKRPCLFRTIHRRGDSAGLSQTNQLTQKSGYSTIAW